MLRLGLIAVLVVLCALGVVLYQVSQPSRAPADPRMFVPSSGFFVDFSPGYRTSIADAYYLQTVQYYGEHVKGDKRFDSLPAMLELVTKLSPHFKRAFFFGSFALIDAARPDISYELLQRGFKDNPDDYRFPSYLGFFVYRYGEGAKKDVVAAKWYEKAAAIPGSPDYLPRLAATLMAKGGEREKAILMWGQVYMAGDKYSRERAVDGLDRVLPAEKEARMKALAPLVGTLPEEELNALIAELFQDHT